MPLRRFLHAGGDLGSREQIPQKQPGETVPTSSRSRLRLTDAVLRYSLDAGSRLTRRRRKVEDRLQRLMQKAQRALHLHAPALGDDETPDLVRLLKREEVGCAVLVGAAQGSWLSEAFMGAMAANPQTPLVICLNRPTPRFAHFHRHYADASVEFRYLPPQRKAILRSGESSGLIVIEQPELLDHAATTCATAQLVVVRGIATAAGQACFHSLSAGTTHDLVWHESAPSRDYAVFRRARVESGTAAVPLQRVA